LEVPSPWPAPWEIIPWEPVEGPSEGFRGENMSGSVFGMSLAPGLGPWGAKVPDRTGQGRMDAEKASIQVSRLPVGERGGERR
jgi:hypothetical protein